MLNLNKQGLNFVIDWKLFSGVRYTDILQKWIPNQRLEKEWQETRLLKSHEIPERKREIGIFTGYRPIPTSPIKCALSVFMASNEAANFWTHFIPALFFIYHLMESLAQESITNDSYMWPYLCYQLTCACYPLLSCLAHTFGDVSWKSQHMWYFMDYVGLSVYSFGVGIVYRAYAFPTDLLNTWYSDTFLIVSVVNAIFCSFMACSSRFVKNVHLSQSLRLLSFVLPYLWDSFPLVYRILFNTDESLLLSLSNHKNQFCFVFLASFFYASHLPEILAPGKFDLLGHSHNLLHVCGILGTLQQMRACWLDLIHRREFLESTDLGFSQYGCIASMPIVLLLTMAVMFWFSRNINEFIEKNPKYKMS